MKHRILLDVDTGIDDALAIAYLAAQEDAEIVGVACTAGNVGLHHVVENTLRVMDLVGIGDVPVAAGSAHPLVAKLETADEVHGSSGLGDAMLPPSAHILDERPAAQLWVDLVRERPGMITGLITGPLTTFAAALYLEPDLPKLLRGLYVMGGSFDHPGNVGGPAEWNIYVDPEAAAIVLDAYTRADVTPPVFLGLNVTETVQLYPSDLARLETEVGTGPVHDFLVDSTRHYFAFHAEHVGGEHASMHDPLAAVVALQRDVSVTTREAHVDVELRGTFTRGMTVIADPGTAPTNVSIVTSVDVDAVRTALTDAYAALIRR